MASSAEVQYEELLRKRALEALGDPSDRDKKSWTEKEILAKMKQLRARYPHLKREESTLDLFEDEIEEDHPKTKKKSSSGPLGAFTDVLGGNFSSIGRKIFKAFTKAFMNEKGEPDFGVKISSDDGVMGIFKGVIHFIFKIFGVIKEVAPVAGEIGKAFESMQQGGANPMAGGSNPLGDLFGLGTRFANAASGYPDSGGEDPTASSSPALTPQHKTTKARQGSMAAEARESLSELVITPERLSGGLGWGKKALL